MAITGPTGEQPDLGQLWSRRTSDLRRQIWKRPCTLMGTGPTFPFRVVGKLVLQFPAELAFVRGLHCRDKRSPFGHTAKYIAPVRVLRITDCDHVGTSRSDFNTLAIAQAVTGRTPARINQTRSRQQHAPSHHFFVYEWWKFAETRQYGVRPNGASVARPRK